MSVSMSPPSSSDSTANFSVSSSPASLASSNTSYIGTSKTQKRRRETYEVKVGQKRRKEGRPKNGWNASRRRKLVRLYLFTELELDDIVKVLRTDSFKPCKRDIQNQLAALVQARPDRIRLRGHATKQRRLVLRECRKDQLSSRPNKLEPDSLTALNEKDDGTDTISTRPEIDCPWLGIDPDWDAFLLSLEAPAFEEAAAQQQEFVEGFDSPTISPVVGGFDLASFPNIPPIDRENEATESLYKELSSTAAPSSDWRPQYCALSPPPDRALPPLPDRRLPPLIPPRSSLHPRTIISTSAFDDLREYYDISAGTTFQSPANEASNHSASELTSLESDNHPLTSLARAHLQSGLDAGHQSNWIRTPLPTTLSVESLINRLSNATDKYSQSTLEDIVSIMEHCTISTSSSASVAPNRGSMALSTHFPAVEKDVHLLLKFEYPVVLPGAFPGYCWEHIMNNSLSRCDRGQKYRKVRICRHTGRRLNQPSNYQSAQYKIYAGEGGEKVDIFGNSALHFAAALATPPDTLISLVRSGVSIHTLNNAGQTFLHLIQPHCHDFCGLGSDICSLLKELQDRGFNFLQQDHNGRTSLHWLTQADIPRSACLKISNAMLSSGIPVPTCRDNIGRSVIDQMRIWGVLDADEFNRQNITPQETHIVDNGYISNYKANKDIETVGDLNRYAYHADLLRTIRKSAKNPRFEDSSGRNGLHCLAEVSFDLDLSRSHSSPPRTPNEKFDTAAQLERNLDYLLVAGVDPNNHNKAGDTPLMAFIMQERSGEDDDSITRTLQRLFKVGADIHRRNRQGETPLHLAVKLGRRAAAKFLLRVGANVHARAANGLGIVALGHRCAREAKHDETLYAQIMLCVALASSGGAVSAPTILGEWGTRSPVELPAPISPPVKAGTGGLPTPTTLKEWWLGSLVEPPTALLPAPTLPTPTSPAGKSGRETPDYFGRETRYKSPSRSFSAPKPPPDIRAILGV